MCESFDDVALICTHDEWVKLFLSSFNISSMFVASLSPFKVWKQLPLFLRLIDLNGFDGVSRIEV